MGIKWTKYGAKIKGKNMQQIRAGGTVTDDPLAYTKQVPLVNKIEESEVSRKWREIVTTLKQFST